MVKTQDFKIVKITFKEHFLSFGMKFFYTSQYSEIQFKKKSWLIKTYVKVPFSSNPGNTFDISVFAIIKCTLST